MSLQDLINNASVPEDTNTTKKGSNLIEPTQEMVNEVLSMHIAGEDVKTIKKTVKMGETNYTLSFGQVREIIRLYKASLSVEPEVEEV